MGSLRSNHLNFVCNKTRLQSCRSSVMGCCWVAFADHKLRIHQSQIWFFLLFNYPITNLPIYPILLRHLSVMAILAFVAILANRGSLSSLASPYFYLAAILE